MRWQNLGMRTGEVYHNRIRPDTEEAKANGIVALSIGYKAKFESRDSFVCEAIAVRCADQYPPFQMLIFGYLRTCRPTTRYGTKDVAPELRAS